jgi:hypothetical protein
MTRTVKIVLMVAGVTLAATAATAAYAQSGPNQSTPRGFNWEIKDGKRVPKGQRQTNADGSWREEIRQGKPAANIRKRAVATDRSLAVAVARQFVDPGAALGSGLDLAGGQADLFIIIA